MDLLETIALIKMSKFIHNNYFLSIYNLKNSYIFKLYVANSKEYKL